MTVIPFTQTKSPLDFDGMDIKIDVEKERESWNSTFTSRQTALWFCKFTHVEAEAAVRKLLEADDDLIDKMGTHWAEAIDYLEATVEIMKSACARLAVSEERAMKRR